MKNSLILVDADGVLLDWEWAFRVWMQDRGYQYNSEFRKSYYLKDHYGLDSDKVMSLVRTFNESAAIGFLPALRDSVYYVKRLHEELGFQFRVITSLSLDQNAARLREMNLRKLFGNSIESVVCLATNHPKDDVLKQYKDSGMWWIEDKIENADAGHNLGLSSLLVEHGYNMHHTCPYPIVKNWKEIYAIIAKKDLAAIE